MVTIALHSTLNILLVLIILQDLKYRAIHFTLPIGVFIVSIINSLDSIFLIDDIIQSSVFLITTILGLVAYVSIKKQKIINPINKSIGLGDILFFIAIIPMLSSRSYILFFISGMLFSIITHLIIKFFRELETIPLAGLLSLYLLILGVINIFTSNNLFFLYF